jgi:hypothetical protein
MRGFSARTTSLARRLLIGLKPTNERLLRQDDILGGGGIGGEKAPVDEAPVPQVRILRVLQQSNPCIIITGKQYRTRQWCDIILTIMILKRHKALIRIFRMNDRSAYGI